MPKYKVHVQEVHFQTYVLEAESAEEAAKRAANAHWDYDGIEWTPDDLEYDHTPGNQTCSVTDLSTDEEAWVDLPRTE